MTHEGFVGNTNHPAEGDVVYFVDDWGSNDAQGPGVKKGTVSSTTKEHNGTTRFYPWVSIWHTPTEEPKGSGLAVSVAPQDLFTSEEVANILRAKEGSIVDDRRSLDELLVDPVANKELAVALGEAALVRYAKTDQTTQP